MKCLSDSFWFEMKKKKNYFLEVLEKSAVCREAVIPSGGVISGLRNSKSSAKTEFTSDWDCTHLKAGTGYSGCSQNVSDLLENGKIKLSVSWACCTGAVSPVKGYKK